jgi:RNA polymerase sigma-70 factor, ECF subfamily
MESQEPNDQSANHARLVRAIEFGAGAALFGTALVIVKHRETAEDVVQETYEKALRSLDRFRGDSRIETWLHRIAINKAVDKVRRNRQTANIVGSEELLYELPDPTEGPDAELVNKEAREEVLRQIKWISPSYRGEFLLFLEGYSHEEISIILNKPLGSVKAGIHRAKKQLKDIKQQKDSREGES